MTSQMAWELRNRAIDVEVDDACDHGLTYLCWKIGHEKRRRKELMAFVQRSMWNQSWSVVDYDQIREAGIAR